MYAGDGASFGGVDWSRVLVQVMKMGGDEAGTRVEIVLARCGVEEMEDREIWLVSGWK